MYEAATTSGAEKSLQGGNNWEEPPPAHCAQTKAEILTSLGWGRGGGQCGQLGGREAHWGAASWAGKQGTSCWGTALTPGKISAGRFVAEGRMKAPEPGRQAFSPCRVQPGSLPIRPCVPAGTKEMFPAPCSSVTVQGRGRREQSWEAACRWLAPGPVAHCLRLHVIPAHRGASVVTGIYHTLLIYSTVARHLHSVQFSAIVNMAARGIHICVFQCTCAKASETVLPTGLQTGLQMGVQTGV